MLTNNHVVGDSTKITTTVAATGRTYPATVVGYDKTGDIALIQLQNASTTSRIWAAVTAVASSAEPSRTASSGSVYEVRPGSSATTNEYGQPGISCAFPFPRA